MASKAPLSQASVLFAEQSRSWEAWQPYGSRVQLPSDHPDEYQMSLSVFSWLLLPEGLLLSLAVQQRPDMTFPGESPSRHIRLTQNLIITDSLVFNEVHVMSFCPGGGRYPATCFAWKGSYLSADGRSSMPGVFSHVQEQTAATGRAPAQEQTWYKYFKYVLAQTRPHSLCCLSKGKQSCVFLT